MLVDVLGGLALARRRWIKIILVTVLIALPSAAIALSASEVITQVNVARAGVALRQHHAVAFDIYDNPSEDPLDLATLRPEIEAGNAYAMVLFGAGSEAGYTSDGHRLIYLIGDAPRTLFPTLRLCQPAPCSMRGHDLRDQALSADAYGSAPITGQDVLPPGAALLAPNAGIIRLDEAVVLVLPASVLGEMSTNETQDAASSAVMLDPTPQQVDRYIDDLARQRASLTPKYLDSPQTDLRDSMVQAGLFVLGTGAFLILVLIAFVASVVRLVEQERRSLTIRRMYGSTKRGTRLRLGTFLACIGVGPTAVLIAMRYFEDPTLTRSALIVLTILAIVWGSLWAKVCAASAPEHLPLGAGSGL